MLSRSTSRSPAIERPRLSRVIPSPSHSNRRHRDYHLSRQDPAVLDHMYDASPWRDPNLYNRRPIVMPPPEHPSRISLSPSGTASIPLTRAGQRHSLVLTSLVKQSSNNNRPYSAGSSIVQLAARAKTTRGSSSPVSPVMVQLSQPKRKKLQER